MLGISELYGGEEQIIQRITNNIGFGIHVALPAVVQSYNPTQQTVDVQPTIRERVIEPNGQITYQAYPLLINVAIQYPQGGGYSITYPVAEGDECIVLFMDLSYDNWWTSGSIQNPVEQRRHDLSDGIAIFGLKNQQKLQNQTNKPPTNSLALYNSVNGTGITIGERDGTMSAFVTHRNPDGSTYQTFETVNFSSLILATYT